MMRIPSLPVNHTGVPYNPYIIIEDSDTDQDNLSSSSEDEL